MRLRLRSVALPLQAPQAAHGAVSERRLLLAALQDEHGLTGYGEAAPLESYDGVALSDVRDALHDCGEELSGASGLDAVDPAARAELLVRCAQRAILPQAVAAVDLALWDLAGRAAGRPVWQLLGWNAPPAVTVNWTIAAPDRTGAVRETLEALAQGFHTVKLKVGTGDDAGRVAAVRAAGGPGLAIRLDANGAWSPEEATRWLEVLAPAGIELCEEPAAGAAEIEALRGAAPVLLAIDESAVDPYALTHRCADAICLKIARCGGISGMVDAARRARALGYEVFIASTFDGPLGIAAAVHAAAVIVPDRACGLATLSMFPGRPDLMPIRAGTIAPPPGAGLGDGLIDWY